MSDFLRWMAYGAIGFAGAYIIEAIVKAVHRRFRKHAEPNELSALVMQERVNQAAPILNAIARHIPIDVNHVTITLRYNDKCTCVMECPVDRMEVEPWAIY